MATRSSNSSADSGVTSPGVVRADGRLAEVVAFEESVIGFFTDAADMLGVPKSVAIIYGIVFASSEPLSFAQIEARLELSKGSISQGLRVLRSMGAIKEVSKQSDRVELFTPDMEMRRLIQRFMEQRLQQQLDGGKTRLKTLQRTLPLPLRVDGDVLRGRLNQLQAWHDKARALIPVARTFLKLSSD